MSTKEQRRNKKLAKKRSKEVAKRKQLAAAKHSMQSMAGQVKAASRGSIDRCYVSEGLLETGNRFGEVLFSRFLPDGRVVMAIILLDGTCLGVKDTFARVHYPGQVTEIVDNLDQRSGMRKVTPAFAKKLVEDCIAWAQQFDLHPHPAYAKVAPIWADVDAAECSEEFAFGDDGTPFYMAGPNDSLQFQHSVLSKLAEHLDEPPRFMVSNQTPDLPHVRVAEDEILRIDNPSVVEGKVVDTTH